MLNGIKQRGIVGKDGKIEIQTSELAEGTVVEIIILAEPTTTESTGNFGQQQDTTAYLLSNQANRRHLLTSLQQLENRQIISFTPEEWDEEHNIHS
ncbi:MAG: hypothetical protein F6K30_23665 [Cyanothece sp. SIO2G6]|nr:hypothetical protein [Cyanothece sp. SIO2G6]